MRKLFLLFAAAFMTATATAQQNQKDPHKSGVYASDSIFIIYIDGEEYLRIPKNKTLYLSGEAEAWDDLRVPVTATTESGSRPPVFSSFRNSGGKYIGRARQYDGMDDYDSIPASPALTFSKSDMSISFWIQPDPGMENNANILYKKGGWNVSLQNRKIRVYLEGKPVFLSSSEVYMGSRNFVVINIKNTAAASSLFLYINNSFAGRQFFDRPLNDNNNTVYIGKAEHRGYGNHYTGIIDELNFWKKFLSDAERDSLWNASKGTNVPIAKQHLAASFSMDEESGKFLNSNFGQIKAYSLRAETAPASVPGLISETMISQGVFAYFFEKSTIHELFFTAQLPHSWIEGSEIEPHVHWAGSVADTGKVVWGLEFTWSNMGEVFSDTRTIYSNAKGPGQDYQQVYSSFGMVNGDQKKISSMLICRIFRDGTHPDDTYEHDAALLEIDFHIRVNSLGSSGMVK